MKHRRPPPRPPPVVVTKTRRIAAAPAPAAPRRAPADHRIKTWHADEPVKPRTPTKTEWLQNQVQLWVHRLRTANDPSVLQGAAEAMAYQAEAQKAAASIIPVRHPHFGECLLITPTEKEPSKSLLAKVFQKLLPTVNFVRPTKATEHSPSSLRPFIKSMRRGD